MVEKDFPEVAFQGAHDAFSEIGARRFFGGGVTCLPCLSFEEVFDQVSKGKVGYGIVPIENSLTGSIHRNVDLLLEHDLHIIGEVNLRIIHNLIANKGVTVEAIDEVYSHPQALEQCRSFILSLKKVTPLPCFDTAGSVEMVRNKALMRAGAIGSREAAETYGMEVLKAEIEDNPQNYTRFLILSKNNKPVPGANKTSIVYSMKNIAGALFKSLSVFALRDIDLLKVESRPLRGKPWTYIFYLDFRGSTEEEPCRNALRHLSEITTLLKVLGSYPQGQ